jgi:hypothetical protein
MELICELNKAEVVQEFFPNAVGFTMICETEISK